MVNVNSSVYRLFTITVYLLMPLFIRITIDVNKVNRDIENNEKVYVNINTNLKGFEPVVYYLVYLNKASALSGDYAKAQD